MRLMHLPKYEQGHSNGVMPQETKSDNDRRQLELKGAYNITPNLPNSFTRSKAAGKKLKNRSVSSNC